MNGGGVGLPLVQRLIASPWASDVALLLLRASFGGLMVALHGWGKLMDVATRTAGSAVEFADPLGIGALPSLVIAAAIEGIGSLLLIAGIATRPVAASLAFTMAVAFFGVHGGGVGADDGGEVPFLYMAGFTALALAGGGRIALWPRRGPGAQRP